MTEEKTGDTVPGQYDTVSKTLIHGPAEDWATFTLGTSDVEVLGILDTEQPTIQTHRADSFLRVKIGGQEAIVHIEMQTHDSYDPPMLYRMAGYIGRAIESFRLPIYSHVIYLAPGAGRRDPGEYVQNLSGHRVHIEYKVTRLSELEGASFLERSGKGLLPFTSLMRRPAGVDGKSWLRRCTKVVDSATRDMSGRSDFFAGLGVFRGLVYDRELILSIIREVDVRESTFVQHFLEQGIQQGREEGIQQGIQQGERASVIEGILETLEFRFENSNVSSIAGRLISIQDIARLKELRRESLGTPSVAAFQETLAASNGSSD